MKKSIFIILIISGLVLPMFVWAQGRLSGPLVPCGRAGQNPCTLCDIFVMIQHVIDFITAGLFVLAGIFIAIGGVRMLTSAGIPEHVDAGKRMITSAIIGIVIALLSWAILNMLFLGLFGEQRGYFQWPWYEIHCVGGGLTEPPETVTPGEYCVCEQVRYSIPPDTIGKDVRVVKLADANTCKSNCISANSSSYCPQYGNGVPNSSATPKLYCADDNSIGYMQACRISFGDVVGTNGCQLSSTCYGTNSDCEGAARVAYLNRCNLDNYPLCDARYSVARYPTFCPTGYQKNVCSNATDRYALWKWKGELANTPSDHSIGNYTAYECSQDAYGNSGDYCRLNCGAGEYTAYGQCGKTGPDADRCSKMNPPLNQKATCTFNSAFTCQQGVNDQWTWACDELKTVINCMAGKSFSPKEISSIADNSPSVGNYSDPGCFRVAKTQCSSNEDSCAGTCCGHGTCTLHYGGKRDQADNKGPSSCQNGSSNTCRQCSWAVDFAGGVSLSAIRTAAQECVDSTSWDSNAKVIFAQDEGNHVHLQLDGVARYYTSGAFRGCW